MFDVKLATGNPPLFCLVRFFCGELILHQKGRRFLIFWAIFESCLWQYLKNDPVVDKTAETQVMNRSTKYVKNQELKRFNNIKGKKRYLLISKVMNRMELSVPIILYLMFIGIENELI